jgi:hypothetical protein
MYSFIPSECLSFYFYYEIFFCERKHTLFVSLHSTGLLEPHVSALSTNHFWPKRKQLVQNIDHSEAFVCFLRPSEKVLWWYLKGGHDHCLAHPLQLTIHYYPVTRQCTVSIAESINKQSTTCKVVKFETSYVIFSS